MNPRLLFISFLFSSFLLSAQQGLLLHGDVEGKKFTLLLNSIEPNKNFENNDHLFYWEETREPIRLVSEKEENNQVLFYLMKAPFSYDTTKAEALFSINNSNFIQSDIENCSGTLMSNKKNITFSKVNLENISHAFGEKKYVQELKTSDPFLYSLTSKHNLDQKKVVANIDKSSFVYQQDRGSQIKRLSVTSGYSKKSRGKINDRIDSIYFSQLVNHLTSKIYFISEKVENAISFHNKSFIVLFTYTEVSGGAHPDFSSNHYVIDAKTGNILQTHDLIKFPDYFYEEKIYNEHPEEYYMNLPFEALVEDYLGMINYPDYETDGCSYHNSNLEIKNMYPTKEGLSVSAKMIRANRICDKTSLFVIPYKNIKEDLNKKYKWPK